MFKSYRQVLRNFDPVGITGRVNSISGLTVSVSDFPVPIGAGCRIACRTGGIDARVVGFVGERTLVMPMAALTGVCRGDRVVLACDDQSVPVGRKMLGRVLDGFARPIDGGGEIRADTRMPIWPEPIAPLRRRRITEPMPTGIRAIDAMLTVGKGQRMAVFSGAGVGKSVLLGMIGRYSSADVNVVALIGERGREVRQFIEKDLTPQALARSVVVVSASDSPPLVRVQAAAVAAAVAEYFRDRGSDVLLLVDSLSRLATAQREIGLAAGEPPTAGGYTPSVFALLPRLLERTGRTENGSVTSFCAVGVQSDPSEPASEPIGEAVRAVTDGHIWLSRELAHRGHYPAVDCLQSVSRVMIGVIDEQHRAAVEEIRRQMAVYEDVEELLRIGAYQGGANPETDLAIKAMEMIREFLDQPMDEPAEFDATGKALKELHERILREKLRPAGRKSGAG